MRKYQETSGYWVYAHTAPNGMYYIGISKRHPYQRWDKSRYKSSALAPYIEQYGWNNIQHKVLIDGLTKEQAEQWEDRIIQALSMNGLCINKHRSGGYARDDKKAYMKQYNEDHKEERKQWYEDHKEEYKARQKRYNEDHKEELKAYSKQWYEDHKEELKTYNKQLRSTPEGKIYNRVKAYNQYHPNEAIETPMEAKQKYLQWGYIPAYIKNDDL